VVEASRGRKRNGVQELVPSPGEWNEAPLAATVWGSASWLVQVTVAPTGTVSVAGVSTKLVMLTAGPDAAAGATVGEVVSTGVTGVGPAAEWPGVPGVLLACDPKLIDGGP
jgi:hypothetical protein